MKNITKCKKNLFYFLGAKTIGAVQRGLTVSHAGIAKSPMVALRKNNINLPEEVESARSIELNIGKKVNKQLIKFCIYKNHNHVVAVCRQA